MSNTDNDELKVQIDFPVSEIPAVADNNTEVSTPSEQSQKTSAGVENRFFFTGEYLYSSVSSPKSTYGFTMGSIKGESFGWYFSLFSNFDFSGMSVSEDVSIDKIDNYTFTGETAVTRLGGTLGILLGGRILYFKIGAGYGMRSVLWQKDNMTWVNIKENTYEGFEANMGFQLMLWRFNISADVLVPINGLDLGAGSIYWEARFGVGFNF